MAERWHELQEEIKTSLDVELRKTEELFGISLVDAFMELDGIDRFCPRQGEEIPEIANYCPYCQYKLAGIEETEQIEKPGEVAGEKVATFPNCLLNLRRGIASNFNPVNLF